jgi:hypothetical protein
MYRSTILPQSCNVRSIWAQSEHNHGENPLSKSSELNQSTVVTIGTSFINIEIIAFYPQSILGQIRVILRINISCFPTQK